MKVVRVLDVRIAATDTAGACDDIERLLSEESPAIVCFANAHLLGEARRDARVRSALAAAALVLPDGAPVAWLARAPWRVTGSDVFAELNRRAADRPARVFLLGSTVETLRRLEENLTSEFPSIDIAGAHAPAFGEPAELDARGLARRVRRAGADIVWVGLGAPKQEIVMAEMLEHLDRGVLLGVGAVFDFATGRTRRAPRWMQCAGLEWLHRFATEPRRLWRRYLVGNAFFVASVAADSVRARRSQ